MSSNETTFYSLDQKTGIVAEFEMPLMVFTLIVNSEEKDLTSSSPVFILNTRT